MWSMILSYSFPFENIEEWMTCHNLLLKMIIMYTFPNYKWYITKKVSPFQWCHQKHFMTSPSCSILMPWHAMGIHPRWNGLGSKLPILMGVKGIFHLVNLTNSGLMFSLSICMDGWIFWIQLFPFFLNVMLLLSHVSFP